MQIAVCLSAVFFTQKSYTTMGHSARQADSQRQEREITSAIILLRLVPFISHGKSFVAQMLAPSKFPAIQRNNSRGPHEIHSINFELNVAPHASGSVLVSMGKHA
jgi:hypothetical protein